jgi:lysine 6-dehydrogenase
LENKWNKEKTMQKKRYAVVGAGRQGTASAYDLVLFGSASKVILADVDEKRARMAASRVNRLTGRRVAAGKLVDARSKKDVENLLDAVDGFISAIPYYHNLELTELAIKSGTHMTDLGGNEEVVRNQLSLHEQALRAGISVIPDCGMGPGMTGSLAAYGISLMDEPEDVFILDGGLPQDPTPPWNYGLTFHINGLTNEYYGKGTYIREGKIVEVPTLTECEIVEFPPLGTLEAFITSGGTSSAIRTYEGMLRTYQNKTLRYPGHCQQFLAYKQLGLFELESIMVSGRKLVPRDFFHALLEPQIKATDNFKDVCLIRVVIRGIKEGIRQEFVGEIIDRADNKTGFTAMERLTGWHASIMLEKALQGRTKRGVHGVETAINPTEFIAEVKKRGISVSERLSLLR